MKQLFNSQIRTGVTLFAALVLSSSSVFADFKNVDCTKNQKKLGISSAECKVLEKLWDSTNGKDWLEKRGWDSLSSVDTWDGVVVENGKVSSLLLYSNNLNGKIPSELGELSALKRLSLSHNILSGEIPASIGELSQLLYLELSDNLLSSDIPSSLGSLSYLNELYLNNNQLSGKIPTTLADLESLEVLKLYDNNLNGNIPSTFGALSNLDSLSLSENNLTGTIPVELGELSKLTYLDLKSNRLTGSIPVQLGNLDSLTGLYLQDNQLIGTIPSQLGNLLNLTDLDLSDNKLEGEIPPSLGNLSVLRYLNVANNQLSGDLPSSLLNLTIMNYLNLEGNKFVFSNVKDIYSELLYIPTFIVSPELLLDKNSSTSVEDKTLNDSSVENRSLVEKKNVVEALMPTTISVLSENELALFEAATLHIVGTNEAGDSLLVENEGEWKIEDDKIVFTPLATFKGSPKSIFYTVEDGNGVVSNPIELSIKRNTTEALTVNLLGKEKINIGQYSVTILLSESFKDKYPEYILSEDGKTLTLDGQGIWNVEDNGTATFRPDEGFEDEPADIEYLVLSKSGTKSAVGMLDIKNKLAIEESMNTTNNVGLFGIKELLLMLLLGGLLGMYYIRKADNKKA